jgi:hypothetical protein
MRPRHFASMQWIMNEHIRLHTCGDPDGSAATALTRSILGRYLNGFIEEE